MSCKHNFTPSYGERTCRLCTIEKLHKELEECKKKQKVFLHKDLLIDEINKLRRNLKRCYDMMEKGVAHIVLDIGELNQCMIETKLNMEAPLPEEPIPSSRIFGGDNARHIKKK